jgi:glc operon protein GlcG
MVCLPAMAQTSFAPPPQIPYGVSVSTESAKNVAATSIAEAQKNNWKMAIAIVDTGGYLVYLERVQDTQTGGGDLAVEKARTAVLFRRPTKVFQDGHSRRQGGSSAVASYRRDPY